MISSLLVGFWHPVWAGNVSDIPVQEGFQNALLGAFPNPFNPSTKLRYSLANSSTVEIDIFDIRGTLIRTLNEGVRDVGSHEVEWDGRDKDNQPAGSGIYLIRIRAGDFQDVAKTTLVK